MPDFCASKYRVFIAGGARGRGDAGPRVALGQVVPAFTGQVRAALVQVDVIQFFLGSVLSFLLFAGSLHARAEALRAVWHSIAGHSTLSALLATGRWGWAPIGCSTGWVARCRCCPNSTALLLREA
ncbi:hypothetical protein HHL22_09445 [Hymenobacter sp. RP-2-7]|uniref:Uncharacterized protein n=1 Tax=Hymenobacter polaris TaxID=2682546 RepID=A0A7Y0FM28_9BACT|nr:hypothetical protein [Hymenobacter polaris]NML65427.1 hypothetical protein [Hymenobacter polaris]